MPHVQTLRVVVFPGGFNWPLWVAQSLGLFERRGLAVELTLTPNSVAQMTGLIEGMFDIAMTAFDNLVAYREGQGAVPVSGAELVAFMGADHGFLRLVTEPGVKSYEALRGRTLSVDALTTGYAFVLFELLRRAGLEKDRDYRLESAGGVLQRFQKLLEGQHAGTLLVSPFEAQAEARGYHRLANALEVLGHYQGVVGGARQSWAEAHRDAVTGYIQAWSEAVEWLYEPSHKPRALDVFLKNLPQADARAAETAYQLLLSPHEGFQRQARWDVEGARTVLALRSRYGPSGTRLEDPSRYYAASLYEEAMRG